MTLQRRFEGLLKGSRKGRNRMKKQLWAALALLALLAALRPAASRAGSLNPSVIGMFPKEVGEFAYADLKTARLRRNLTSEEVAQKIGTSRTWVKTGPPWSTK